MSNYWATAMIIDSIERERRRAADAARGARPSRFDDGGFIGGADPGRAPGRGRRDGDGRRLRRFSLRGGPLTVSVSISLEQGGGRP